MLRQLRGRYAAATRNAVGVDLHGNVCRSGNRFYIGASVSPAEELDRLRQARRRTQRDDPFQIGQSKAIRNVVLNCLPAGLHNRAIEVAKGDVKAKIEKTVEQYGFDAVVEKALARLEAFGVDVDRVLEKFKRHSLKALTLDDLVLIRADVTALENEQGRRRHVVSGSRRDRRRHG